MSALRELVAEYAANNKTVLLSGKLPSTTLPAEDTVAAVKALVDNAFEASTGPTDVRVEVSMDRELALIRVSDKGKGIPPEKVVEMRRPFVTTKAETAGMGLGLFLVDLFVTKEGGEMHIEPRKGGGTVVELRFPSQEKVAVNG